VIRSAEVASTETPIHLTVPKGFPPQLEDELRRRLERLRQLTDRPLLGVRLTLRTPAGHKRTDQWVADASVVVGGRPLAAHATGPDAVNRLAITPTGPSPKFHDDPDILVIAASLLRRSRW